MSSLTADTSDVNFHGITWIFLIILVDQANLKPTFSLPQRNIACTLNLKNNILILKYIFLFYSRYCRHFEKYNVFSYLVLFKNLYTLKLVI